MPSRQPLGPEKHWYLCLCRRQKGNSCSAQVLRVGKNIGAIYGPLACTHGGITVAATAPAEDQDAWRTWVHKARCTFCRAFCMRVQTGTTAPPDIKQAEKSVRVQPDRENTSRWANIQGCWMAGLGHAWTGITRQLKLEYLEVKVNMETDREGKEWEQGLQAGPHHHTAVAIRLLARSLRFPSALAALRAFQTLWLPRGYISWHQDAKRNAIFMSLPPRHRQSCTPTQEIWRMSRQPPSV